MRKSEKKGPNSKSPRCPIFKFFVVTREVICQKMAPILDPVNFFWVFSLISHCGPASKVAPVYSLSLSGCWSPSAEKSRTFNVETDLDCRSWVLVWPILLRSRTLSFNSLAAPWSVGRWQEARVAERKTSKKVECRVMSFSGRQIVPGGLSSWGYDSRMIWLRTGDRLLEISLASPHLWIMNIWPWIVQHLKSYHDDLLSRIIWQILHSIISKVKHPLSLKTSALFCLPYPSPT